MEKKSTSPTIKAVEHWLLHICSLLSVHKTVLISAVVASVLAVGSALLSFGLLQNFVDYSLTTQGSESLRNYLASMLFVLAIFAVSTACRRYLVSILAEYIIVDIRQRSVDAIIHKEFAYFEKVSGGALMSQLNIDTENIRDFVHYVFNNVLPGVVVLPVGATLLWSANAKLFALSLILVPLVVVPLLLITRPVGYRQLKVREAHSKVSAAGVEAFSSMMDIKAFTGEQAVLHRIFKTIDELKQSSRKLFQIDALMYGLLTILIFGGVAFIVWLGIGQVVLGELTPGILVSFVGILILVAVTGASLAEGFSVIRKARVCTLSLMQLWSDDCKDGQLETDQVRRPTTIAGKIEFRNVSFSYPSKPDRCALKNLNLAIEPGSSVAIVGPSGTGKTTIFKLLLRLYDNQEGAILIDDVPLSSISPFQLRKLVSLVPQEPKIFAGTLLENVSFANPKATDQAKEQAIRTAFSAEFIENLPEGFNSELGENGVRLSGGEKQRLSIARVLIRPANIVLLDEATNSIDSEAEREIQIQLQTMMRGKTALVIAHRLSTVTSADQIIVLDNGEIAATGTHDQLMFENGVYARLARLQLLT